MSDKIKNFDPSAVGDANNNIYGLPFTTKDANVVIIPLPWEVTVSYSAGTAAGPEAVFDASFQVDLFDPFIKDAWKTGIAMDKVNKKIKNQSRILRKKAEKYIDDYTKAAGKKESPSMRKTREEINTACKAMNQWLQNEATQYLNKGKIVGLLGGDHSTPLGLMQALATKYNNFGILQIDAHADLRDAYEGFEFSHASIMFNALKIPQISKLVQLGIRDYCEDEFNIIQKNKRITTFFDRDIKHKQYTGTSWDKICDSVISTLPKNVYISFDIDGLDPKLCPNTGTPVAGGFEFEQIVYLLEKVVKAKKTIIGFDLNEVSPGKDEWDANVGARMLYKLANLTAASNK